MRLKSEMLGRGDLFCKKCFTCVILRLRLSEAEQNFKIVRNYDVAADGGNLTKHDFWSNRILCIYCSTGKDLDT